MRISTINIFIFSVAVTCGASPPWVKGQGIESTYVDLEFRNAPLKSVFEAIEGQTDYLFVIPSGKVNINSNVDLPRGKYTIKNALDLVLQGTGLGYQQVRSYIVVFIPEAASVKDQSKGIAENEISINRKINRAVYTVSGIVKDASTQQPLAGVNIIVKGTTRGTTTDVEGKFSIDAEDNDVLVFSFIGFKPYETQVSGRTVIDVPMELDITALQEVVVLGYGTMRKRDMIGSSSGVSSKTISEIPPTSLENALQGRMAGVNVTITSAEPGGGINILIRGATSLAGGNQPLYVIDGVPQYNDYSRSTKEINGNIPTNALATLNPSDVESVEVLKDASSVAIYGSRGANGVILITTKRGKLGEPVTNFSYYATLAETPKYIPLANAREAAEFMNLAYTNSGLPAPFSGTYRVTTDKSDSVFYPKPQDLGEGTNWQKEIFRSALTHNYQLTVSGGTDAVKYFISGNFLRDQGVLKNTQYQKGSIRANIDAKLNNKLSARLIVNIASDLNDRAENTNTITTPLGFSMSGVIQKAFLAQPFLASDNDAYKLFVKYTGGDRSGAVYGLINPLNDLLYTTNQRKNNFQQTNLDLVYNLNDNLNLTVRGGYNTTDNNTDMFWGLKTEQGFDRQQKTYLSTWKTESLINENFITYNKLSENFNINLVAGASFQKETARGGTMGGELLAVPSDNGTFLLPLYTNRSIPTTNYVSSFLVSGFGRLSFSYKDKYLLSASGRSDASSKFAVNNKWAFFPAFGIGWNFTEENILKGIQNVVSNGKIRFSYGVTGNQAISPYQSLAALSPISYGFITGVQTGVVTSNASNPDLKWETTKQTDLGLDLAFMQNKYQFSFDLYKKVTNNLLQYKNIPSESGYRTFLSNFGSIENRGVEVEFGASMIQRKNFSWDLAFNASSNKNKILDLGEGVNFYNASSGQTDYTHRLRVGGSLGDFWGYQTIGLLTDKDVMNQYPTVGTTREGDMKIRDVDANGVINDADKVFLGNAFPKVSLGLSNNFSYKNWVLNVFLVGVLGQDIMNQNLQYFAFGVPYGIPSKKYLSDYWTPENKNAYYPRPSLSGPSTSSGASGFTSDRLVEDGSFVRIKTVTLRYSFKNIPKWINKAEVYITGNNLFVLTKYSGYDPEVSGYGQNILTPGIEVGSYPRTRIWTLGFDFQF